LKERSTFSKKPELKGYDIVEIQERYWQAVECDRSHLDYGRAFDSTLAWTDRFELFGRLVERQATLLRLCHEARDEAFKEIYDPPRPKMGERQHEFKRTWSRGVLHHEKLLRDLITQMELMQLRKPKFDN
jgi:hypothetical protein